MISRATNGARIVTTGDINLDGKIDIIVAVSEGRVCPIHVIGLDESTRFVQCRRGACVTECQYQLSQAIESLLLALVFIILLYFCNAVDVLVYTSSNIYYILGYQQ